MENNELKVLAVADPAVRAYQDTQLNIISNFKKSNVVFDVFPWDKYYSTMMDVFSGKTYYDIVMIAGHLWKREMVEKANISPLSFSCEDILPVIADEMSYQGNAYLSPSFCDGHMIVYRKDIIKEVLGRELPKIITPQQYCETAKKLAISGHKIAMKAHSSEIFTDALPFLRMNGTGVYNDETHKIQCACNQIIDGLKDYCRLKQYAFSDTATYGNEEIADKIKNGQAAMATTWSGQMGVVCDDNCKNKENLGFSTFTTAWNVTWSFAISSKCQNQELANEFLEYLRSPENDALAGAVSGAPVRKSSYANGFNKYPWYRCQMKMISKAKALPDIKLAGEKNAVLYEEIAAAFKGVKSSKDAMKSAAIRIRKLEN